MEVLLIQFSDRLAAELPSKFNLDPASQYFVLQWLHTAESLQLDSLMEVRGREIMY